MISETHGPKWICTSVRRRHFLRAVSIALVWFVCGTWSRVGAEERRRSGDKWNDAPIWQLDLRSLDFNLIPMAPVRAGYNKTARRMFFTSEGILVTAFVMPGDEPSLPETSNQDDALKWRLRATVIDTATGRVTTTKDWSVDSPRSRMMPDGRGGLLLISRGRLVRYSSELVLTKELLLPHSNKANEDMPDVLQSPSGKTILLRYYSNESPSLRRRRAAAAEVAV